jgi:ubiquinone biosynthesis protein
MSDPALNADRASIFVPRPYLAPAHAQTRPRELKGGYALPGPLHGPPRELPPTQEWLARWDEGKWGFWAILKILFPLAIKVIHSRLTSSSWRREFWAEVREVIERLGGLWTEIGDLLARRPDLIGPEGELEMAGLRPTHSSFPIEVTELLFLKQFGSELSERFSRFDELPLSVGIYSQTYRARLRQPDVEVIVKVLRPDVAALLLRDSGILHTLIRLSGWFGFSDRLGLPKLEWEVKQWLVRSSDLRYQAASMKRLKRSLRRHRVYVPRPYYDVCSSHFLSAEFLDAPTLAEWQRLAVADPNAADTWMKRNNINRHRLSRRLFQSFLRQVLVDNLFHSDLTPSNVILFRNGRFGIPTAGPVSSLDRQFATYMGQMFRAIAASDYSKAVDFLFLMCDSLPRLGLNELRVELVRLGRTYEMKSELHGVSFAEKSYGALSSQISELMFKWGVVRSWQGINIDLGWTNLEQSLQILNPDFNFRGELKRYFERVDIWNSSLGGQEGIRIKIGRLVATLSEQTMLIGAQLRRRAQRFEGISKASYLGIVFFRAMFGLVLVMMALVIVAHLGFERHNILRNSVFGRVMEWIARQPLTYSYFLAAFGVYSLFWLSRVVRRLAQTERAN